MSLNPSDPHDLQLLEAARDTVEANYVGKGGNAHTFSIGEIEKEGRPTGEVGIIVKVEDKIPRAQLLDEELIPSALKAPDGTVIPVDIQVMPQPRDMRLMMAMEEQEALGAMISTHTLSMESAAQAGDVAQWRRCHNLPLPGGVQIAPERAGWVGTLGAACKGRNRQGLLIVGAITNYHVAVAREEPGIKMGQPSGNANQWFAQLERWAPINFSTSAENRVDGAFLDTWRTGGIYGEGVHTVHPEQFQIGRIDPRPIMISEQKIGDKVQKSGRTTGVMTGRVVGIRASTHVGYEQGTARFVDQLIIKGDTGDMSQPGDSGSLIMDPGRRPYALLFAGGGGTTIANPIEYVNQAFGLEWF